MTAPAPPAPKWPLIDRLQRLAREGDEDRAALAALRRGLGKQPGEVAAICAIVEPFLGDEPSRALTNANYLAASLFGLLPHQRDTPAELGLSDRRRGLGWSLRPARFRDDGEPDPGMDRRFVALLDTELEELDEQLRHLIKLAKSRDDTFALDYGQLIDDILAWDHQDRYVQRRWAAGFWARRQQAETGSGDSPADDTTNDNDETPEGTNR